MTIDRMLRRGQFPILSERPLDESEVAEKATAKVYVVEVGAYSDRYIDAIFTTRELADAYVLNRQRRAYERDGRKERREVEGWQFPDRLPGGTADEPVSYEMRFDGTPPVVMHRGNKIAEGVPTGYRDVPAETFEQYLARNTWNEFGDVEEYDLWDVLPVVQPEPFDGNFDGTDVD